MKEENLFFLCDKIKNNNLKKEDNLKTPLTLAIEKTLYYYCLEQNYTVIEEVSLPNDLGIVDTLALEWLKSGKAQWRCYEIKVSKSDFRSKARLTFAGDFNYFVLPLELFEKVASDIPKNIGVLVYRSWPKEEGELVDFATPGFLTLVKKAKRQESLLKKMDFFPAFLTSLQREVTKAKQVEKGLQLFSTESLYQELKRRLLVEELSGKLLTDLAEEKIGQLTQEITYLKQQQEQYIKRLQVLRRQTQPLE